MIILSMIASRMIITNYYLPEVLCNERTIYYHSVIVNINIVSCYIKIINMKNEQFFKIKYFTRSTLGLKRLIRTCRVNQDYKLEITKLQTFRHTMRNITLKKCLKFYLPPQTLLGFKYLFCFLSL